MSQTEGQLLAACQRLLKRLREQGYPLWWVKTHGTAFSKVGTPDLLICVNGRFLGVELKTAEGEATPIQLHTLTEISNARGYASLCRSVDDLRRFILATLEYSGWNG